MSTLRFVAWLGSLALTIQSMGLAWCQSYPDRPIRMITGTAGGGSDFAARVAAQGMAGPLGQPVIVDNRPSGALGVLITQAPPDGYTLLVGGTGFLLGPLLSPAPYDALRDLAAISTLASAPNVVVVHPAVPAKSVKDLIALAKAKPGTLNYAMGAIGATTHLAGELFKSMAGINIVRIAYKGTGPGVAALVGGEVQLSFANVTAVMPHVKADRLRALAVTSAAPSELTPGIPTVAASGLPGYEATATDSVYAPTKTPKTILYRLNQEIVRILRTPDAKARLRDVGVEAVGNSVEESDAMFRAHIAKWAKVIKDAGIRTE